MPMDVSGPAAGTGILRGKVHANFIMAHRSTFSKEADSLAHAFEMMDDEVGDVETVGYWEAPPRARYWPEDTPRTYQTFKSSSFTVVTRRWQSAIEWKRTAREDDRTKSLRSNALAGGEEVGLLPRRCFFQMLLGSVDADLLPAVGLAPDGGAIFSATDGASADRFQLSGGNIESGGGVATSAAIITDAMSVVSRFLRFKNSAGTQVFGPSIIQGGFIVYFAPENLEVFEAAFKGKMLANAAGTAATSNLIQDTAMQFDLRPAAELTGTNDWFVFIKSPPEGKKPFAWTNARPVEAIQYGVETGHQRAIDLDVEGVAWSSRWGFGPALPWSCIKVDN